MVGNNDCTINSLINNMLVPLYHSPRAPFAQRCGGGSCDGKARGLNSGPGLENELCDVE